MMGELPAFTSGGGREGGWILLDDLIADPAYALAAQLLLLELQFDGTGGYLAPPQTGRDVETAEMLADQLAAYNNGALCR